MVFEEQVAYYLDKYLGKFVKGLSKEALKISVWAGNVELTNMQLKPEALNALKLPIKVKAGFLGSVKLKVPWSRLGQEPVVVYLDKIFLLAEPATNVDGGDTGDAVQEAKMTRVTEAERKLVEAREEKAMKQDVNNSSWLGSLISTIIGNLKLTIGNIHIRYEDLESNPGHPFAAGLTLEKLAAVTVDEKGKEIFVTGGSLDRIQKRAELQRLAVYFDPDSEPWKVDKNWEDLRPNEWAQIFVPGIKSGQSEGLTNLERYTHSYILQPVGGNARYYKLANKDQRSPDQPAQKATVFLDDVTVGLSEGQYRDGIKMVENFSTFNKRLQFAHYRPSVEIKEDRRAWWQYAFKAVAEQQKRASGQVSWSRVVKLSGLRKKYVSLYVSSLQSGNPDRISVDDNKEIKYMDRELDTDVIIQWSFFRDKASQKELRRISQHADRHLCQRMLAHTYVDSTRAKDQQKKQQQNRSWWSWGWGGGPGEEEPAAKFTEEDLEKFNQIIGYQEGQQSNLMPGQDPPNMLHTLLDVHMRRNATKLVGEDKEDLLELSADDLQCVLHMYPKTIRFNVKLDSYQVACPEGLLAESATKTEAVNATFTYLPNEIETDPSGDKSQILDWSLAAKASPCYATVLMRSVNKIIQFFQSSKAVSRSVALDTATALQTTLDEVTRNAQQQINEALKDRPRFSIDLNLAAPKVTIPTDFYPDGVHRCNLLVDLGYFSLQTELDDKPTELSEENQLYMRFRMKLSDVSAILVDGEHDWSKDYNDVDGYLVERKKNQGRDAYLPVLERCGILLAVHQICVPHPKYPTTRVALRLPSVGFHLSPARYHRLMQVANVFQSSDDDDNGVRPWEPSDFEGRASVLTWKGVGHREAVWQHRHAVLTGPFLYLLESPNAQSYKYCSSLIGKQVYVVPPESVGNVPHVLAVCDAGQFNKKVAESVNALLLRFEDESNMSRWQASLTGAIYRTSAPAAIASLVASKDGDQGDPGAAVVAASESVESLNSAEQEKIFVVGVLDELKIFINNSQVEDYSSKQILLEPETPLLEFRAIGTKVEFAMKTYDMYVGAVLQALEIEDKCHGHVSPSCKYLARSYIKTSKADKAPRMNGRANNSGSNSGRRHKSKASPGPLGRRTSREMLSSESDRFFDAEEDLDSEDSSSGRDQKLRRSSQSLPNFFDAEEGRLEDPPTFKRTTGLLPVITPEGKENDVVQDEVLKNFVKVQAIMSSQDSPDYANVDKQVTVTLATLAFFSNRRTLLALLDLVKAISAEVASEDRTPPPSSTDSDAIVSSINPAIEDGGEDDDPPNASFHRNDSVVQGLLGRGKSRIVFLVVLNMDRAQIVLNLEDGVQLSVLSVEDLHTEVKIFPESLGIQAALGNLQVSDGSLDEKHPYHYICNMRDPDGASFIALEFLSFNKEDDDYEGYEYSIMGKLSELRIVYLNRFVQEIVSYFMGLVPKNAGYVVKLKDTVTDVEKFFDQSEIEGSPAMKLGLSLNKPVITMPRSTASKDFLELDILHINLFNNFQWLGGDKDKMGAVRLETTTLELEDLHLVVGVNGQTGEGIIQEARGLALVVRRPIRDLWHQLPAAQASIKIEELRAALSDQEYQVITECAISNMAETPNLPPPVIESAPEDDKPEVEQEVETIVHEQPTNAGNPLSNGDNEAPREDAWTTVKVGIDINMVELVLFTGQSRESPLAAIQVTGVWASYKSNTLQESNIQATLEKFSVRDDREGTESEMRYMVGNADDAESNSLEKKPREVESTGNLENAIQKQGSCSKPDCRSALTMLVLDAKLSPSMQVISMRIQRPRLLVALDFLLAVAEFFIPSIHAMLSDGKGNENPLEMQNAIFLQDKFYTQSSKEIILSPKKPLVADKDGVDTHVYDGRAGYIRLLDRKGADLRDFSKEVIIFVGDKKKLVFKNVIIQNGDFLDSCISLGNNSSYSALEEDGVFLEGQPETHNETNSQRESGTVDGQDEIASPDQSEKKPAVELMFDLQAVSPELTFYDSMSKVASEGVIVPEKLLRMRMNVFSRFVMKGDDMELNAQVNGMTIDASSGIQVMEPVDMVVKYTNVSGKQSLNLASTEIHTNFSFSIIQLILRLQLDVMSFLRITSEQLTVECSEFDKVWAYNQAVGANCITFWRPRAPPGFAILGDCMTPLDEVPSKGVIAVNMSMARVKKPSELILLWSSDQVKRSADGSGSSDEDVDQNICSVWLPVPPPGYIALGCVASTGKRPPPLNTCFCVLGPLVSPSGMKDCIIVTEAGSEGDQEGVEAAKWSFWRVDNSTGSFFLQSATEHPQKYRPHELRTVLSNYDSFPVQETKPQTTRPPAVKRQSPLHNGSSSAEGINPLHGLSSGRFYENVARFNLVWWDKNSGSRREVSIWRPVVPSGCVILGDVAVEGYEPPSIGLVLHDAVDRGLLAKPERFVERGQLPRKRGMGSVTFWHPLPPPGYEALGCIASVGSSPDPDNLVRCVRSDYVIGSNFSGSSLWDTADIKHKDEGLSIWQVENQAFSFITQLGFKHPPKRLGLRLADLKRSSAPDNLEIDAEVKQISATIFDDFGGLMAPLVDLSVRGIKVALNGRTEVLSSTVNFSLAATTFNGKNNSWEPLIESWDGRIRFEYSSDPSETSRPTESRLRLTASSAVNLNITTANLNMFFEAYASWNRLNRIEENSKEKFSIDSRGRTNKKSAITVKNRKSLSCVNHNELGEDLFLRIFENNHAKVLSLPSRGTVTVKLSTAQRMPDPDTYTTRRKHRNKIVALRIGNAKVPKDDGIGGREYMVAIRIVPSTQTADQRQLQYQSARTRCVPPDDGSSSDNVVIHWDEVFIFEVEPQEGNSAEITVTDLSKGTTVGYCTSKLSEDEDDTTKLTSDNKIGAHIPWDLLVLEWQPLYSPEGPESNQGETKTPCGKISLAQHFFSLIGYPRKELDGAGHELGTIQVGPSREGPWNPVGLNYALGPIPWTIHSDVVASEFYVEDGVKHLVMRSLVGVQNCTDFDLEVSLALISTLKKSSVQQGPGDDVIGETFEEEFFENERYQPIVGWGSKWPGHLLPTDPARYSARDYTDPLKEFPDVKLPLGWEWQTNWHVEKVPEGDQDGWGYGFDFRNMEWPPANISEKVHSFVRRRRWLRIRQSVAKGGSRVMLGVIKPGVDLPLPMACLRPTSANYCLQIRPTATSHGVPYEWSQVTPFKGFREGKKQQVPKEIRVRSLIEAEHLLSCAVESSSSTTQNRDVYFCLEATSNVIGNDADVEPIKEWKLTITASIMLRNYLPVPCEYSVSEKSTHNRLVVRDRGVIQSGDAVGIFHIDLRKGVFLTWLPQGGWNPKKETVLISHPYREPASYITYVNTRTSRSLKVMIDHDREEKGVAAKVLLFYVPCWLDSAKCPPLQYRLMEIIQRGDTKVPTTEDNDYTRAAYEGVKVGNITEQVDFEEKDDYPTMLSDMDLKTTGLSVAINRGNQIRFGPVAELLPLENPDGYFELRALAESGSTFRFLVSTASCPLDFVMTKVIRIRPYILFTNRVGEALDLRQKGVGDFRTLQPSDWRVSFSFPVADELNSPELLQIKLEGYEWSYPFSVEKETSIAIPIYKTTGERRFIKVDVRGYEEGSRFSIMFRLGSTRGPYRLENRTADVQLRFRQLGLDDNSWQMLKPHSTKTFAWEDPQGPEVLEVLQGNADATEIFQYDINKVGDHAELPSGVDLAHNVSVRVIELLEIKTLRFYCKIVELEDISENEEIESSGPNEGGLELTHVEEKAASAQIELFVNIGKLGLSITDQHPREILYLSLDNVVTSYQIGFGERTTRLKVRIGYLQLDNQLPLSRMPVLFAPERKDESKEFLMKISLVMYDDKAETRQVYPYVGMQVESAFRINVHEPIIWAVVDMFNNLHLDRLSDDSAVVQVDPEIRIDLIDLSEVRLKLTLETAAGARPRGMLGIWSPLVTTIGNTSKMPIRLGSVLHHNRYMRKSAVSGAIINRIKRDLIHQPLQLLSGVDVLGMTSSTIGTLSQGAAELSKDGKYLRLRTAKDRSRNVAGVGDGLLQGTEALARGFAYGISGVVTKPITNAREHGFVGFFQGVGKAALGFVMLPVSGVLDFVSLTVNGVGVSCTSCFEIFDHEPNFTRRRLPRAIPGSGIIVPYKPYAADGQAILQLAQSKSFYGVKVFTEAAKFAWSDFYEVHFELPRSKILMLTNRRIILLERPKSHSKNPEKSYSDPSDILWDITWRNLLAVESHQSPTHGPCLLLHLRRSSKSFARTVKCQSGNADAGISHLHELSNSLHRLWKEYGPDRKIIASETSQPYCDCACQGSNPSDATDRTYHPPYFERQQQELFPPKQRASLLSHPKSSTTASRKNKYKSGSLSLNPRLKQTEVLRDGGSQERMVKSSNGENGAASYTGSFTKDVMLFEQIWISEQDSAGSCCAPKPSGEIFTIWRPNAPEGYVSIGDIARIGSESPPVAITYRNEDDSFAPPLGYTLVWRNWKDGFCIPVSIWMPKAPEGYVAIGFVAVPDYLEPDIDAVWCVREDLTEVTTLEEKEIWHAPSNSPWNCHIYTLASDSLTFTATREPKQVSSRRYRTVKVPT